MIMEYIFQLLSTQDDDKFFELLPVAVYWKFLLSSPIGIPYNSFHQRLTNGSPRIDEISKKNVQAFAFICYHFCQLNE